MPADTPSVSFLHRLADAADAITLPHFHTKLVAQSKSGPEGFDPVTVADRAAEAAMRAIIETDFPDHGIWGEEFGQSGRGVSQWVLDPIDGTRPYLCGIPVWATLIGFMSDDRAEMGLVSQPFTGERFWACDGVAYGERLGQRSQLRTSVTAALSDTILHTTSPEYFGAPEWARFSRLRAAVKMTRYGAECYAVAMLASGLIDLNFEPVVDPCDVVALIPLVRAAGGVISRLDGGPPESGGAILASATPRLHEAALQVLNADS